MKFELLMYMDPVVWQALTDQQRNAVFIGHEAFQVKLVDSGELLSTQAVAEPAESVTVRVIDGATIATSGVFQPAAAFMCGHYVVDCASQERAVEIAALIPDAAYTGVEVRRIIHEADLRS